MHVDPERFPAPISWLIQGWLWIVRGFSWLLARLVTIVTFVLILVPYGIVLRLVDFDPLDRRLDESADSYWGEPPRKFSGAEDYEKMY